MCTTLLLCDDDLVSSFYSVNLTTFVGSNVVVRRSLKEAKELFEDARVDLIVAMDRLGKENISEKLYGMVEKKQIKTPLIIISNDEEEVLPENVYKIKRDYSRRPLMTTVAKVLNISPIDMVNMTVGEYFPIDISLFHSLTLTKYSLFSKATDENGKDVYLEILSPFEKVTLMKINILMKQGHANLFVEASNRLKFVNDISEQLSEAILLLSGEGDDKKDELVDIAQRHVSDFIEDMKFSEEIVDLADVAIESVCEQAFSHPPISSLLKKVEFKKASIHFKYTQLITIVSAHILDQIDWGTTAHIEKISFSAFFNDLLLKNPTHCKVRTETSLADLNGSEKVNMNIRTHSQKILEYLKDYPFMPIGADIIIRQHHGTTNGHGFRKDPIEEIQPLSMVFIISQEVADVLIDSMGDNYIWSIVIERLRDQFSSPSFQKVIDCIVDLK